MMRSFKRLLVPAVLCVAALSLSGIPAASAKLSANTVNTTAIVSDNGRKLVVNGPFTCTQREWMDLRVTVTQRTTGAVAEGYARFEGSTSSQQWEVKIPAHGDADFEPGAATVVAFATTSLGGDVTDAHQWLVNVTLVEDE